MSNIFSFVGICGRDSEVKYLPSGSAVLSVTVACNTGFGDRQKTLWIRASLFGKRAEGSLKDYLKKGQQVFVSGELSQNEYQAKDGTIKTSLELVATVVDLIGKRSESAPAQTQAPAQQSASYDSDDYEDNIPF